MSAVAGWEEQVRRILVVRFSAIGDIILTLPVVDALHTRFPEAEIEYLTRQENLDLVSHHPGVNRVWPFDRSLGFSELRRLGKILRERKYDLLIDLHQSLRSIYIRAAVRPHMARSYRKLTLSRRLLELARWNTLRDAPPVIDRYFTALEDFGVSREGRRPRLSVLDRARERSAEALLRAGLGEGEGIIVLAPGASHPTKRWPPAAFAAAALALTPPGSRAVVLGGNSDREIAAEVGRVMARSGAAIVDVAGRLALGESAAVIERASLVITNDSGLMHMADALDRPLVAVFGPTSRELGFYPTGPRARVAELPLDCRPCTLHGSDSCRLQHHRCLQELPVEAVVKLARGAMEEDLNAEAQRH